MYLFFLFGFHVGFLAKTTDKLREKQLKKAKKRGRNGENEGKVAKKKEDGILPMKNSICLPRKKESIVNINDSSASKYTGQRKVISPAAVNKVSPPPPPPFLPLPSKAITIILKIKLKKGGGDLALSSPKKKRRLNTAISPQKKKEMNCKENEEKEVTMSNSTFKEKEKEPKLLSKGKRENMGKGNGNNLRKSKMVNDKGGGGKQGNRVKKKTKENDDLTTSESKEKEKGRSISPTPQSRAEQFYNAPLKCSTKNGRYRSRLDTLRVLFPRKTEEYYRKVLKYHEDLEKWKFFSFLCPPPPSLSFLCFVFRLIFSALRKPQNYLEKPQTMLYEGRGRGKDISSRGVPGNL